MTQHTAQTAPLRPATPSWRPGNASGWIYQNLSGQWVGAMWDAWHGVWAGGILPGITTEEAAAQRLRDCFCSDIRSGGTL